jgi:hypothetical protein
LVSLAQTDAVARLDTNAILIGDQVKLELSFYCPVDYTVKFPQFADTLTGDIEIVKRTDIDSSFNESKTGKYYRQTFTITSFDSGYYVIPPIRFQYKNKEDNLTHFAETDALLLEVHTVQVNMEQDLKDIKGPIDAPFTFREALPYILIFLAVALAAFLLYYFIRKRKKSEPVFRLVSKPKIPAHQIAIDELEALRYKKLWQKGQIKEYHTELVDIIRQYLTGKFEIHALEFTSDEILDAVNGTATNGQAKQKLANTLMMADMVKFAKFQPMPLEHDTSLNNALDFVKETSHLGADMNETPFNNKSNNEVATANPEPVEAKPGILENERKEAGDAQ